MDGTGTADRDQVEAFCRRNHIRRLSLFGSVLRPDFSADSDIDVLVEFEEGKTPGFFGIARMQRELTEVYGRRADLRTPQDLSRYFRHDVLATAQEQYAAR